MSTAASAKNFFKSLLTPWRIATILIGFFLLGQGYLSWRNLAFETALSRFEYTRMEPSAPHYGLFKKFGISTKAVRGWKDIP